MARQAVCDFPRTRRGNDRLSRLLACRRGNDGEIFLQASILRTFASGARRQSGNVTLGAQPQELSNRRPIAASSELFSLERQHNDLIVIKGVQAAAKFKHAFESRFTSGQPIIRPLVMPSVAG